MQIDIKPWICAARLYTLPLSLSGVIISTLVAFSRGYKEVRIFIMACLTTLLFQILANFANDYGDGIKGADDARRIGPKRTVQSGLILPLSMKKALFFLGFLSFISAMFLIYLSFENYSSPASLFFIFATIASLFAAIKYTIGKNAYGYKGLGDLYVFLFFGLTCVKGGYFLYTHQFECDVLLLAAALGFLNVAVLNLNNMRDIHNDRKNAKYTFPVQIGFEKAKVYHFFLVSFPFILGIIFIRINEYRSLYRWTFLVLIIPVFFHLKKVFSITDLKKLNPELKKIVLITLLYALTIGLGQVF